MKWPNLETTIHIKLKEHTWYANVDEAIENLESEKRRFEVFLSHFKKQCYLAASQAGLYIDNISIDPCSLEKASRE